MDIDPKNITKHPIDGIKCNCGMQGGKYSICPVDYEKANTDYGPVARLRCPCGSRTNWHLRAYPGDLAAEWVKMQARARMRALTSNWPTDHRERKIRDLERRCRELEWAREEAEVYEWGRREMGKMADEIDDLRRKNEDYIERLLACGKAAESAEKKSGDGEPGNRPHAEGASLLPAGPGGTTRSTERMG